MTKFLSVLLATASFTSMATSANAQSATPNSSEDAQAGVGDIIVTAQKKEESAQRAPAAITALSGAALVTSGITDIRAAQAVVPSARFQMEGTNTQIFIRGIGSNLDVANIEPTVAFNVNGMFVPREATGVPLFDIERLEVLPGPQGTLYGRAAIGGTVNAYFKRPTNNTETTGLIEVGNYSNVHATLVQNLPLSEGLAIRLAGDYTWHDGYQTSGAYSANDLALRAGVQYDGTSGLKAYLWGYYYSVGGYSPNLVVKGLDPKTGTLNEAAYLNPSNPWDDRLPDGLAFFGQSQAYKEDYKNWAVGGQFDIDVGGATLTYIPTYISLDNNHRHWLGQFPLSISPNYRQTSHEFRLSGDSDKLQWLVGLYGFRVVNSGICDIFPGAQLRISNVSRNRMMGAALFGQATYKVSDTFRVTAGGRLSYNSRTGKGTSALGDPYTYDESWTHVDYKLGVEYDLSDRSMAYLTVQTAFQPGTYNEVPSSDAFDNRVQPAKMIALTGGIKNRFLDDKLQVNVEAFLYDYKDLFLQSYDALALFNPIFNAKKVQIYGLQLDTAFVLSKRDRLNVNVAYTHGENKDFVTPDGRDFSGKTLPFSPRWTVTGSYHHDFPIANGYVRAQAEGDFQSGWYGNFTLVAGTYQKAAMRTNASLTYNDDNGWYAGAYVKNITDEAIVTAIGPARPGIAYAYLAPPRTYGVRLGFTF